MLVPVPEIDNTLYEENYFMQRSDRGYNNYFSEEVRKEIERVLCLNLRELNFFDFESSLPQVRRSIDIGCAAGYCVRFLRERGWLAQGIDISASCTAFAKEQGLDVICGNYLAADFKYKFDLITLWATIEHLPDPRAVVQKIAADLAPGGILLLSTCNVESPFARLRGSAWRYYNFPEHIHFFRAAGLRSVLRQSGLALKKSATYGSGFGKQHSILRKSADRLAKAGIGDMILIRADRGKQ